MLHNLSVLTIAAFVAALIAAGSTAAATLTRSEVSLLKAMNEVRKARNLPPLRPAPRLARAARAHTRDMVRRRYFGHGRFSRRIDRAGVRARVVAENLAWTKGRRPKPRVVVRMWLRSPPHRANLLRPGFRWVGISALRGRFAGVGTVSVVTVDFAGR